MSIIRFKTRKTSFEDIDFEKRKKYEEILDRLMTGTKTFKELNITKKQLIELKLYGLIEKKDNVYEITPKGIEQRYSNHIPYIL